MYIYNFFYIYIYIIFEYLFLSQYNYLTINITYINVHKRPRDSVHCTLSSNRFAGTTAQRRAYRTHSARVFAHAVGFSLSLGEGDPYIIYTYIARRLFTVFRLPRHGVWSIMLIADCT